MFRSEIWAEAFVQSAGTLSAAEETFEYVKVFCYAALKLPGDLSGKNDADRLGRSIRSALEKTAPAPELANNKSARVAERFIQLMLRKNCFHHYKKILKSIEKIIDKQNEIEEVFVESAVPLDKTTAALLEEKTKKLIGAKKIKLTERVIPELIGGLRLRWGSVLFDGSIKRGLERMAGNFKAQTV